MAEALRSASDPTLFRLHGPLPDQRDENGADVLAHILIRQPRGQPGIDERDVLTEQHLAEECLQQRRKHGVRALDPAGRLEFANEK